MSPPFIPDYKKSFIRRQFIQTCLGGLKFFAPFSFVTIQVILFFVPLIIMVPVSLGTAGAKVKAVVTGCSIFLVDFFLCMGIYYLKRARCQNNVTPVERVESSVEGGGSTGNIMSAMTVLPHPEEVYAGHSTTNFLSEEDEVTNEGILKPSTWSFIAPNVSFSMKYFAGLIVSSWAFGLCTPLLTFESISGVLRGFDLFALGIARYSAVINAPSEIATFNLASRKHYMYRPFYAALVGLSNALMLHSTEDNVHATLLAHGITLAVLPIIWASGILPSLDALIPWVVETILGLVSVGSLNVYYFGTVLSLIISGVCPVIVFVVTHDPLYIILSECLCGYIIACDIGRIITMKSSLCEDTPTKSFLRILLQPVLIISTSLICVLLVWLTMSEVIVYDWQLGFSIVSLIVSISSWIFQDIVSTIEPDVSKILLVPMSILYGLIQFLLHVWLTLVMRQDDNAWSSTSRSGFLDQVSLGHIVPFLLTIRAFSMAICDPRLSSLDYTIAFLWKASMGDSKDMSFVVVVFIVSIVTRRIIRFMKYLKMFVSLWHASLVSNLLEAKVVLSAIAVGLLPISILSILLASICEGLTVTPLFTLPILLLSFPRPMSFWKDRWFPTIANKDKAKEIMRLTPDLETVDWKIYSEIGPLIAKSLVRKAHKFKLKLTKGSCYLARYEDRLIFVRILSCCWNFTYVQVKGLEMQEQTSCHHQEAAEVDEKLEDSLDTTCLKKYLSRFTISNLSPRFSVKVPTYSESKSSVANLTNPQDKSIFQDMFYRAFSYLWIKSNPVLKGESYQKLMNSNTKTTLAQSSGPNDANGNKRGIASIDSRDNNLLNRDFSVTNALFKCTLPSMNLINLRTNAVSNPSAVPSSSEIFTDANEAPRKASLVGEDPAELKVFSRQSTRSTLISPTDNRILVSSSLMSSSFEDKDSGASDRLSLVWIKQCVGDVIPSNAIKARVEKMCRNVWLSVMGNDSDLEIQFWEFFHEEFIHKIKSVSSGSTPRKVNMEEITLKAFRYATKLTLDEMYSSTFISDTTVITLDEVKEEEIFAQLSLFEREYEFCTRDEIPLKIHERTNRIISIVKHPNSSDVHDSIMRILNYETEGVEFRVGQMDQFTVEGIWSNLNLELLYFTSDDDERFSIQSDRQLLRNIVTQCAKTPLGYPVYEATFRINLFDFSVTEVN